MPGLLAGYTYTFEIISYNNAGNSTQWTQVVQELPIEAPYIDPQLSEADKTPSIASGEDNVKHDEVKVIFRNVFSPRNGVPARYSLIAIPNKLPQSTNQAVQDAGTWANQFDVNPQGPFVVFKDCESFFADGDSCPVRTTRAKRQAPAQNQFQASMDTITVTIGKDKNCNSKNGNQFCNGPLRPETTYYFLLRAYSENNLVTDLPITAPVKTKSAPLALFIILIIILVMLLMLIVLVVAILIILRRRGIICAPPNTSPLYIKPDKKSHFSMKGVHSNRPVKISEFSPHVANMGKDSDFLFAEEYEELKPVGREQPCDASELPVNRNKNRFTNILPYDHSRVKLLPSEDEEGSDYINANWMPGFNSKREFICTQGPLPSTTDDFWRMVWEQNCRAIVMLTKCLERGREKCHHYWPVDSEPMFYGDVQVEILQESKTPEYVITMFQISKGSEVRQIKHFHYMVWPDMKTPETHEIIPFIRMFRNEIPPHSAKGPILVHCSAGVGRSGTFIVLDRLLQHVKNPKDETIDVYGIVYEMRKYRVWMVQTEQQYICIHKCVQCVLEGTEYDDGSGQENRAYEDEGIAINGR